MFLSGSLPFSVYRKVQQLPFIIDDKVELEPEEIAHGVAIIHATPIPTTAKKSQYLSTTGHGQNRLLNPARLGVVVTLICPNNPVDTS